MCSPLPPNPVYHPPKLSIVLRARVLVCACPIRNPEVSCKETRQASQKSLACVCSRNWNVFYVIFILVRLFFVVMVIFINCSRKTSLVEKYSRLFCPDVFVLLSFPSEE